MSLWRAAWRYVWSMPLVAVLTLVGIGLGAALISGVLTLRRETERTLVSESGLFDVVVGAKGSPLQLVLSSVYHLDSPTGNIPYSRYQALEKDARVRQAIPLGLGDNYQGFRIVGTEAKLFDLERPSESGKGFERIFSFAQGKAFEADFEAVLGADAAQRTGLIVGDSFLGTHGLISVAGAEEHEKHPYRVVGVLARGGTSNDRAIFVSLPSVWRVHEEEARLHEELFGDDPAEEEAPPEEELAEGEELPFFFALEEESAKKEREVTAVLIQLKAAGMRLWMQQEINAGTESMAAIPINEMLRLYQGALAPFQKSLLAVAGVVVAVAALSILATLYQAAERRRRDVAVMRSLGARPAEIFALVLMEAAILSALGVALGWLIGHGGAQLASTFYLEKNLGLAVRAWATDRAELIALGVVALSGVAAGLVPAALAYRRPPAEDLAGGA